MNHTQIEYAVNADGSRGYSWNFLTGCTNGPDICKTRDLCWAKTIAGRFHRDFTPTFHEDVFNASFPRKPGARILVCFTGDISWANYDELIDCRDRIYDNPQHTFILLTKRPFYYKFKYVDWPSNAWLGVSLTGAETPERQQQVLDELRAVRGKHKLWLSYEPMLDRIQVSLEGIDWLVLGAQTGKGAIPLDPKWDIPPAAFKGPRWYKNNLGTHWDSGDLIQELPI